MTLYYHHNYLLLISIPFTKTYRLIFRHVPRQSSVADRGAWSSRRGDLPVATCCARSQSNWIQRISGKGLSMESHCSNLVFKNLTIFLHDFDKIIKFILHKFFRFISLKFILNGMGKYCFKSQYSKTLVGIYFWIFNIF